MREQVAPEVLPEETIKNKFLGWLVVYPVVEFIRYGVFFLSHLDKKPVTSSEILKRYRMPTYMTTMRNDFRPILMMG